MSHYLLDTDMCIYMIRGRAAEAVERLQSMDPLRIGVSAITFSELRFGVSRSSRPQQNHMALARFLSPIQIHAFDGAAAAAYGPIRAHLASRGTPIGPLDTLIGAHAVALGHTLISHNLREFRRVPGLRVESWLKA